jgi:hypothetical protein
MTDTIRREISQLRALIGGLTARINNFRVSTIDFLNIGVGLGVKQNVSNNGAVVLGPGSEQPTVTESLVINVDEPVDVEHSVVIALGYPSAVTDSLVINRYFSGSKTLTAIVRSVVAGQNHRGGTYTDCLVVGDTHNVSGRQIVALGQYHTVSVDNGVAVGYSCVPTGQYGMGLGFLATAGLKAVSICAGNPSTGDIVSTRAHAPASTHRLHGEAGISITEGGAGDIEVYKRPLCSGANDTIEADSLVRAADMEAVMPVPQLMRAEFDSIGTYAGGTIVFDTISYHAANEIADAVIITSSANPAALGFRGFVFGPFDDGVVEIVGSVRLQTTGSLDIYKGVDEETSVIIGRSRLSQSDTLPSSFSASSRMSTGQKIYFYPTNGAGGTTFPSVWLNMKWTPATRY